MLLSLADLTRELGDGSLRLTPWQSILLPHVPAAFGEAVLHRLETIGLVCSSADPLAAMIACSGSAGCNAGLAATQQDGLDLAARLRALAHAFPDRAFPVHLSGCGKSCAAITALPATLVGVAPGQYDLFLYPADLPAGAATSRFGQRVAASVTIDQAAELIAQLLVAPSPDSSHDRNSSE
jgi:precorrin-3B synthase